MKKKLIIIGASGHGKVIADIAVKIDKWNNIAFLDDDMSKNQCLGFDVIGPIKDASKYYSEADFFVAIGDNKIREDMLEKLESYGASIVELIHPNATIGSDVRIGKGTVVMAGVVINSSSTIGKGCIINTSCSIDHDNVIENYVHVSPGANLAGSVTVGKSSWIGVGSSISNNVRICENCIIGAGAVVIKDICEPGSYVGVPVRRVN